jgi:hypothetical protein
LVQPPPPLLDAFEGFWHDTGAGLEEGAIPMRRFATIAIVLGLAGGLLGVFAFNELSGRAGAAAGQQREDQILLIADGQGIRFDYGDWQWLDGHYYYMGFYTQGPGLFWAALDSADYPANSTVRLEAVLRADMGASGLAATACVRLTADMVEVPGTEACYTQGNPGGGQAVRVRSEPVALASGEHEYSLQGQVSNGGYSVLNAVRIIVEWTEPSPPVGGTIELFPSISDSAGQNYLVLAGLALIAGAAFAAGAWYARRRWLG